jgi:HlyD family secretion protein
VRRERLDDAVKKWQVISVLVFLMVVTGSAGWRFLVSCAQAQERPTGLAAQVRDALRQPVSQLDRPSTASKRPKLIASGIVEAQRVSVMSEVPGMIVQLAVDEGDQVEEGELLIRLDDEFLDAQLEEARAAVGLAEASLARAKLGLAQEQVRRLEALVAKAEVARDWSYVAWTDASAIRENPQDLEVEIAESRARVVALDHQVKWALAMKDAAEIAKDELARSVTWLHGGFDVKVPVPGGGIVSRHIKVPESKIEGIQDELNAATTQWWQAWVGVNTAAASRDWSRTALSDLLSVRESPQDLQSQVNMTWAQYQQTQAAVELARAQLALARAGASDEELAIVEAQVAQARTAYEALATQRNKRELRAPIDGRAVELMAEQGETIRPGAPLLGLVDLDEVKLTLYIPAADIALVALGQPALVTVDSYADRQFSGEVVRIASQAEFTPRNVQTREERASMVFAVTLELPNLDAALKPGMPADAILESGS